MNSFRNAGNLNFVAVQVQQVLQSACTKYDY